MKSNGSLAEHDFPSLVQDFYEQRRTGVLTLTHAGVGRSVTIQEGRLVFASSSIMVICLIPPISSILYRK